MNCFQCTQALAFYAVNGIIVVSYIGKNFRPTAFAYIVTANCNNDNWKAERIVEKGKNCFFEVQCFLHTLEVDQDWN